MKYVGFLVFLLYLEFGQKVLSEKRESKSQFLDAKNANLDYKVFNETNGSFERQHPQSAASCICRGGTCVTEGEKEVCKCPPGFGNFTGNSCKECNCGPGAECYWGSGFGGQTCLCKPGYYIKSSKCVDCECGPAALTCEFVSQGWLKEDKKVCKCQPGAEEKYGKCVVTEKSCKTDPHSCNNHGECIENKEVAGFVCRCADGWKGQECDIEMSCRTDPHSCNNNGVCIENIENAGFVCNCADRWKGPECDIEMSCKKNPHSCNNHGKCIENKEVAGFVCICEDGWKGQECNIEKSCRINPHSCNNQGECIENKEDAGFVCRCEDGWKGQECEIECNCGPYGSCRFDDGKKQCDCMAFAIEMNGVCVVRVTTSPSTTVITSTLTSTVKDCDCGPYSYSCYLDSTGYSAYTVCRCFNGYSQLGDICAECNCGPYGECRFELDQKKCNCKSFAVEMSGVCVDARTSSPEVTTNGFETTSTSTSTRQECNCGPYGSCSFEYGRKKCHCESFATEMNGVCVVLPSTSSKGTTNSIIMSTLLSSTVQECDCGEYSNSCHFNWKGDKICSCISGYVELRGICLECNCGANARSCFYRSNGTKVCNCNFGYIPLNGQCAGICSEDKCVHGKCEIIGNNYKCRCNDGFTGERCEEKVQIKQKKQDFWLIFLLLIAFATFVLLFGVFCLQISMLKKTSNK